MSSEMSPLTRRFAHRWHVEPRPDGLYQIGDEEGHRLKKHFFTAEAANTYARQLT